MGIYFEIIGWLCNTPRLCYRAVRIMLFSFIARRFEVMPFENIFKKLFNWVYSRVYFWYHYVMNNYRKYCAFNIHFCSWTFAGGARVGARPPSLEKNIWEFLSPCVFFFLVLKCFRLVPTYKKFWGRPYFHC